MYACEKITLLMITVNYIVAIFRKSMDSVSMSMKYRDQFQLHHIQLRQRIPCLLTTARYGRLVHNRITMQVGRVKYIHYLFTSFKQTAKLRKRSACKHGLACINTYNTTQFTVM